MSVDQREVFYKDMKGELEELKRYMVFYNSYMKKASVKKNRGLNEEIVSQKKRFDKAFNNFLKPIE